MAPTSQGVEPPAIPGRFTHLQKLQVLVRITPRDINPANPAFAGNIIRYNNTQNAIKEQDFISNDPVQIALVKQFAYTRFAKTVVYQPKRGPRPSAKFHNIEVVEFAQRMIASLESPIAYRGSIPLLMTPTEKHYRLVFGDGAHVYERMPEGEFRYRSGIWWMSEEFDAARLRDRKLPKFAGALDSLLLLLFVSHGLLVRNYGEDHKSFLASLYQGAWRLDGTKPHEKMLSRLYALARDVLNEDFTEEKEKSEVFKPTEWKRSDATIARLARVTATRAALDALKNEFPKILP